jgi:hypothetical protein
MARLSAALAADLSVIPTPRICCYRGLTDVADNWLWIVTERGFERGLSSSSVAFSSVEQPHCRFERKLPSERHCWGRISRPADGHLLNWPRGFAPCERPWKPRRDRLRSCSMEQTG